MKNIDSDLIRGNIDTIILTTMLDGDKYGLDIIKEVEIRSNGTYELKQPTLYSCLKRLENQELISSYWLDSDIGGRRHYYKLTEKGKDSLLQKQEEWTKSKFIIDNLLSNHDYDEYRLVKKEDYEKIIEGKKFDYQPEQTQVSEKPVEEDNETLDTADEIDEETDDIVEDPLNDEAFDDVETVNLDDEDAEEEYGSEPEKRIDYHDDNDDAEADYPNQKRFKIPDIYDKIKIDENEDLDEDDENDDDEYTASIYSSYSNEPETEDEEDFDDEDISLSELDLNEDDIDEITDEYTSLLEEEMALGNLENDEDDEHVYVRNYDETSYDEEDNDLDIPTNTLTNQTANELNILSKLRGQEDEEINEYYGDKNSYINHLNKNEDIETLKSDNLNVVQEDLLSNNNYLSQSSIDNQINELTNAIKNLNEFGNDEVSQYNFEPETIDEENEELDSEIEEELITNVANQEESKDIIEFKQETNTDDYLNELDELKNSNNNGYFNSLDTADYSSTKDEFSPISFDVTSSNFEDDADAIAFNEQVENYNNQYGYNQTNLQNEDDESVYSSYDETQDEASTFASFDDIISKNMNDYSSNTSSEEFKSFTPRFTENNYKQKLNSLSAYSKTSNDAQETTSECANNEEIMNKVKDIKTLKTEFASDGILVKEYKKSNGHTEDVDRNYLLSNKLNFVKSLILLFGYIFVLSAVFIIMNNTSAQTIENFSFKYFLIGFIPFIVYAIYHTVMFVISPYKKVLAKIAPRIMIFISVIITIQLLLITYCLNLQMGFYSFSQSHYNHLLWVIPTIISFAPIISTLIHMALYYSKNFNV